MKPDEYAADITRLDHADERPLSLDYEDEDHELCWQCEGQGWGIVGVNWDCQDAINGPYNGEIERCPCCGGSGLASDCEYW